MISQEDWWRQIEQAITNIASREYQKSAWFNADPSRVSSPVEVYCALFDDALFEEFLSSSQGYLSGHKKAIATELIRKMNEYGSRIELSPDPIHVIDDPAWKEIRELARKLIS